MDRGPELPEVAPGYATQSMADKAFDPSEPAQIELPHVLATPGQRVDAGFVPGHAQLILEGLRRTPLVGTAKSACISVRGRAGCDGLGLAMKTGTSLFPQHALTVAERAARCQRVFQLENELRQRQRALPVSQAKEALYCALYPMKWAVLIEPARAGGDGLLTVVLAERNTRQSDGRLDAGDDRSPNVAAEAALLLHAHRWAAVAANAGKAGTGRTSAVTAGGAAQRAVGPAAAASTSTQPQAPGRRVG